VTIAESIKHKKNNLTGDGYTLWFTSQAGTVADNILMSVTYGNCNTIKCTATKCTK